MIFKFCVDTFKLTCTKVHEELLQAPGVGVGVGFCVRVAQMLKFLVKVFVSLYLLNFFMDQVDTLHVGRYWSEVLFCTIMTHLGVIFFVMKSLYCLDTGVI